jgi:hypothetical protein
MARPREASVAKGTAMTVEILCSNPLTGLP